MYTSACIEEERIVRTLYRTDIQNGSHSYSCNDKDHAFDYQLYQWGVEKLCQNSDEAIIRDLKLYIEYWEILASRTRDNYHILCFLQNTVVWLYMMEI